MSKPSINFKIEKPVTKGPNAKKFHIKMWITFKDDNWVRGKYKTNIYCTQKEWDIYQEKKGENRVPIIIQDLKEQLEEFETKAKAIIDEYNVTMKDQFESYYLSDYPTDAVALEFGKKIAELDANDQISSKEKYESSLKTFQEFFGKNFTYTDCTAKRLKEYENWYIKQKRAPLQKDDHRTKSLTTVGINMRNLKHIFRRQVDAGFLHQKLNPFGVGENKYVIPKGGGKIEFHETEDMSKFHEWVHATDQAAIEEIKYSYRIIHRTRAIEEHSGFRTMSEKQQDEILEGYAREIIEKRMRMYAYARFCFYAHGINISDFCRLTKDEVFKEHLSRDRQKSKDRKKQPKKLIIPIHSVMREVMKKYGKPTLAPNDYVFPVLDLKMNEAERWYAIRNLVDDINDTLAIIAKQLNFDIKTKTYTLRHSFAFRFLQLGRSTEELQDALGHGSITTTENYKHPFALQHKKKISELL